MNLEDDESHTFGGVIKLTSNDVSKKVYGMTCWHDIIANSEDKSLDEVNGTLSPFKNSSFSHLTEIRDESDRDLACWGLPQENHAILRRDRTTGIVTYLDDKRGTPMGFADRGDSRSWVFHKNGQWSGMVFSCCWRWRLDRSVAYVTSAEMLKAHIEQTSKCVVSLP